MSLSSLFTWFVDNMGIWIVAGFAGWKFIQAVKDQKIGQAIITLAIGGFSVYFLKNPTTILNSIGEIVAKIFN
ncbi:MULTISPECIES: TcpD family membrane protein [unclassified Enterococcus]|uniref:TcpD family membrane protein n=1 Tax=unclassified Enterococcus TaxID=2608891 RepID=UPI0015569DD7|nr:MULTISPECIES: TcpD family membrane protein [unclassified Enterococcus]MBS7576114.1 hypothetical protein [Enterococcus sp. MMGLQ5-2]MBS7583347.1 hypothetical protein [Enterococcus sp. MMGLQ5-1]NPD11207.1 hypothetical protein [Enterococcus sp. MMGLQ5-1]NPD35950.1 hypothetical protein [Enterococcus sp. MMGLQ5-2]